MHYRPLGKTGLSVSQIGYGASGIGGSMWIGAREDESVAALRLAIERGVNFIDTGPGGGLPRRLHQGPPRDEPAHPGWPRSTCSSSMSGATTGQIAPATTFPAGDFRNRYFAGGRKAGVERHINVLTADLGIGPDQVAEFALRYVLANPAVSTVLAGMRTVRNVERNTAIDTGPT